MLDQIIGWCVAVLVAAAVISFVCSLVGVARLPDERPRVLTYDKHGGVMGEYENPGPRVAPGRGGDPIAARERSDESGSAEAAPGQTQDREHRAAGGS